MKNKARHLTYNSCVECGKEINGQKEGKSNYCYSCSAKHYRNPSKTESRVKIKESKLKYYQLGGKPWNLNLKAETSEEVSAIGRKISMALTGKSLEDRLGHVKAVQFKAMMSAKFRGAGNPMFGKKTPHRKGGFRADLGHYVRSSWEADFARILRLKNINYVYEPITFTLKLDDGGVLHYTPDFFVPAQNTFYEVKGWMHELDEKKIALFQEQYPQYNFVLINTTKFAEFALKFKSLIQWECPRIPTERSFEFQKVKAIRYHGHLETYDVSMTTPGNNFVANGFLVHNSDGMKKYLKELKPTCFEDIVAMVALYRPGPIQFIPDYIDRKHGRKQVQYLHPKLEPILKNTQGICVYQEQLMQIARDIAGFSLAEADILRKAIGKKIPELLRAQKDKFVQGAVGNNVSQKVAEALWEWVLPFASYGFNRSHSVAYSIIAYNTAYLKSHYPPEFMSALLTSEKADVERIAFLIDECKAMGIEVLPPEINESFRNFSVVPGENKVRFGLLAIKNVGSNIVEAILEEKKANGVFQSFSDFASRINNKDFNKKSLESMAKAGVFDNLAERGQILDNMEAILSFNRDLRKEKSSTQKSLFGSTTAAVPVLQLKETPPATTDVKLLWEKELLGLYISAHPLHNLKHIMQGRAIPIKELRDNFFNYAVRIGGVISSIKKIITKKGQPMLFMKVEDLTDKAEVVVFPSILESKPEIFQENKIVFITGRVDSRKEEIPTIICQDIEEVLEV
jgi:hypothetical protein